jgi:hypothetical protein
MTSSITALALQALACAGALVLAAPSAAVDLRDRIRVHEGAGGTTCSHLLDGAFAWERRGGDWRDAKGKRFGAEPFASAATGGVGAAWDTTALVNRWVTAGERRGRIFLRWQRGASPALFHSREAKAVDRPLLALEYADGSRELLSPTADTHLDCSTIQSLGRSPVLMVSERISAVLEFDLPAAKTPRQLTKARLALSTAAGPGGGGSAEIALFEAALPGAATGAPLQGLAAAYAGDRGIERDPQVIFAVGFEQNNWQASFVKGPSEAQVVSEDAERGFAPLAQAALRINLKKGSNYGADLRLQLKGLGGEPEELYFRYYLRLARDWNPTADGGKLPGPAGTYNRAGWGGRRADGSNGWSMRGAFARAFPADHPLHGWTQLQSYAYHADMPTDYGEIWTWPGALLERERWYCVEQHVRLNRPNAADGEFQVWLDGRPVFQRKGLRFRKTEELRIETVWLDVYHGGVAKSPHDQHLYIDNVVVARRYIGPIAAPK